MQSRTTLLVTCSTVFLAQLGMSIYLPALQEMARHLTADTSQVSWGLAVLSLLCTLLALGAMLCVMRAPGRKRA